MEQLKHWESILNISIYAGLVALIVFLGFYWKLDQGERRVAHAVFLFAGCDIVATVLIFVGKQNLWLYNWVLVPQIILVTFMMVHGMQGKVIKNVLIGGSIILTLLHILNMLAFQGYVNLAYYTYIPCSVWMAVCSFYYLREQLEDVSLVPFNFLLTWFALATLIDNAGSMPILSVLGWSNFISQPIAYHLYAFVTWLYAFWFLIILTGLLWTKTPLKSVFYSR